MFEVYKEILQITKKKKQVNRNLGKKRNQAFCKKETWFKKKKKKRLLDGAQTCLVLRERQVKTTFSHPPDWQKLNVSSCCQLQLS